MPGSIYAAILRTSMVLAGWLGAVAVLTGWGLCGPALAQPTARVAIGDLALTFDPGEWQVEAANGRLTAICARPDCQGIRVIGGLTADLPSSCSEAALRGGSTSHASTTTYQLPGAALHLASIDLGCRNLVSPRIAACVVHAGNVYRFDWGPDGCRGGPGVGRALAVIELLKRLTTR